MKPRFYCLTVKESPWRNERVAKRFKDAGLDVEFFYGVHGQTVGICATTTVWDAPAENGLRRGQHPFRSNPGKMSITISKMLLWQHIIDTIQDDEYAVIFENDVKFVENFQKELAQSTSMLPADWEAVHIGYCCHEGKPSSYVNDRVITIHWPLCCHAMMWTKAGLRKAYQAMFINYWGTNSDIILQRVIYPTMKHYCFTPALAFQDISHSEAANTVTWEDVQGWFDWQVLIDEQLTSFDGHKAVMVEVGSWKGRSTIYTAEEIKRRLLSQSVRFYAVDTWEGNANEPDMQAMIADANAKGGLYQEFMENVNRCGVVDYVTPLRMTSVEAAKHFKDGEVSFCFIDGDHSYDGVMADLRAWYPKVHYNSCMAGHDLGRPDVRRAVTEFCAEKNIAFREWQDCWIINHCHRPKD